MRNARSKRALSQPRATQLRILAKLLIPNLLCSITARSSAVATAESTVPQSSEAVLAKVREMELPTIERQDNCQVAVSLSLANDQASLPVYGCLCHRNGRAMTNVCARRRFLTTSPSRSNTRLRSIGYAGLRAWSAARRGADGGQLWQQQRAARPNYGAGSDLRCGHSVGYHSMVSWDRAVAAQRSIVFRPGGRLRC